MGMTTVYQCRPVSHQRALRCLAWAVLAGSVWVELFGLAAFGQEQKKPVIKIIATGGTIANTGSGRIPFQPHCRKPGRRTGSCRPVPRPADSTIGNTR